MFHWQKGWFFERQEDGSVRIVKRESEDETSKSVAQAIIPADEWASIVSTVSAGNEVKNYHSCPTPTKCFSKKDVDS